MTKHIFLIILLLVFIAFGSCKKPNEANPAIQPDSTTTGGPTTNETSIIGDWEIRVVIGGYREPNASPYFPPGNGFIWKFKDSTFQHFSKGRMTYEGKYILTKDTSLATGRLMDVLILLKDYKDKIHFEFNKDTLVFYRGLIAADGSIEKYVRLKTTANRSLSSVGQNE